MDQYRGRAVHPVVCNLKGLHKKREARSLGFAFIAVLQLCIRFLLRFGDNPFDDDKHCYEANH